jgi:tRNA pseudouridine55 synthase
MIRAALVALGVLTAQVATASDCESLDFDGARFTACTVDMQSSDVRLFLRDPEGEVYGTFTRLQAGLPDGVSLNLAMNAGMFHEDLSPVGLYIEDGAEVMRLVTRDGPGNFGLLPNGVLCISDDRADVIESLRFAERTPDCRFATQSGPMLVIDGGLHPRFREHSASLNIRNGVGVSADGRRLVLAISDEPVNFHTSRVSSATGWPRRTRFTSTAACRDCMRRGSTGRISAFRSGRSSGSSKPIPPLTAPTAKDSRSAFSDPAAVGAEGHGYGTQEKGARHLRLGSGRQTRRCDLHLRREQGALGLRCKKGRARGTLDPDATGLLPVALGEATKTIAYLGDVLKGYDFTVRWGSRRTTDDAEGEVIETSDARPSEAEIVAALPQFTGDIRQVPPQFSAVKVDGNRAYDMARAGETMELAARDLYVDDLSLLSCPDADHAELRFVCGSGGYVRSIARDLGRVLGCLGHVVTLRRAGWGPSTSRMRCRSTGSTRWPRHADIDDLSRPVALGLSDLPELRTTAEGAARLKNGNPGHVLPGDAHYGDLAWASLDGQPVAVGRFRAGELHPERVFNL